jgi:hypothetical protein
MPLGQALAGLAPVGGAALGTLLGGPIGGIVGGGLGQAGGNLLQDYFKQNSPAEQARAQLLQQLQGQAPYQRVNFDPIAQEEMRRFNRDVVPGIANQFAGLGGLNSSGYRQALSGAGQDLQTRLAALRAQHELGQNQFATGAEERRRQMLANLSGGMFGEEQAQQMGRMNQFSQLAGQIPGMYMNMANFNANQGQNGLANILSQLVNQQNAQNNAINQTGQLSNVGMGNSFENVQQQIPTRGQQAARYGMDALGQLIALGGGLGSAALGARR